MNMRYVKATLATVLAVALAGTASAQMMNGSATSAPARSMQTHFQQMQQVMDRAHQSKNWNERMRLMQSHMQMMQQQMGSMMGMPMRPGQRMGNGPKRRRQGQGMRGSMMGGANGGDNMQAIQARMGAMQARMREMARMMQQMMEQQQLMLQTAAANGKNGG